MRWEMGDVLRRAVRTCIEEACLSGRGRVTQGGLVRKVEVR